jgi:GDP-D-mannose 3', 5'-epimerase
MKRVLVNGAGGFIGGHLVKRLKAEGYWVRGVDSKQHEYTESAADEFLIGESDFTGPVNIGSEERVTINSWLN